jgi:hypothetical protein
LPIDATMDPGNTSAADPFLNNNIT